MKLFTVLGVLHTLEHHEDTLELQNNGCLLVIEALHIHLELL